MIIEYKVVVEIKRGDPVPKDSKWLKDTQKLIGTKEVYVGHHPQDSDYETVNVYEWFDVYEVKEIL